VRNREKRFSNEVECSTLSFKNGDHMKLIFLSLMLCTFLSSNSFASSSNHKMSSKDVVSKTGSRCDYTFKKYCAKVIFEKKPSRSYSSDFKIYFTDVKTKKEVMPSEDVYVYLWMKMGNGHEHGSDEVKMTKHKDHYLIKNVWFVMIGSWELYLVLKKDGKEVEKEVKKILIGQ
jgi:hypothetical protein